MDQGSKLYFRPLGLISGAAAELAVTEHHAAWLAGGQVAFTLVEIVDRDAEGITSVYCPYSNLSKSTDDIVRQALGRLTAPRPRIAGLSMDRTQIMGIVNVTPDSFSDGGLYAAAPQAVARARQLHAAGAAIIDIGGESTRPGAQTVPAGEELNRVLPVLEALSDAPFPVSIDSRKPEVLAAAVKAGVDLLNDVSALSYDPQNMEIAAKSGLPVVLMHAQGSPETMQDRPSYDHVLYEVYDYLEQRINDCIAAGIERSRIVIDPGIGFGKTRDHNLELLSGLSLFHGLGVPILIGASRKRFIGDLINQPEPVQRMPGSIAAAMAAAAQGVQLLRCHDVQETWQALTTWQACMTGRHGGA